MSLITYEGVSKISLNPVFTSIFILPYLLRVTGGLLNKDPAAGLCKKSYLYLALLLITTGLFNYFQSYASFVLVLINLHIVLLTITSVNKVQVPHYLEFFNTISFFSVFWTPVFMWAGAGIVWGMNVLSNLMCGKAVGIVFALGQIAAGILAFTAANHLALDEFCVTGAVSLALMIGQVDLLRN